jgi:hypothetical protein
MKTKNKETKRAQHARPPFMFHYLCLRADPACQAGYPGWLSLLQNAPVRLLSASGSESIFGVFAWMASRI